MNRLKFVHRFALISFLFLLLMAGLIYFLVSEVNEGMAFAAKERTGVAYLMPLRLALQAVQQHRGMTAARLGGAGLFASQLDAKQKAVDAILVRVDAMDSHYGRALQTTSEWNAIKTAWRELSGSLQGISSGASFTAHTALIDRLIALMMQVADTSNLTLDPDPDSYCVMDMLVTRLPLMSEALGMARGIGAGVAARAMAAPEERASLLVLQARIRDAATAVRQRTKVVAKHNAALALRVEAGVQDLVRSVSDFVATMGRQLIDPRVITIDPKDYFAEGTEVIDRVFKLYDALSPELDGLLQARIDRLAARRFRSAPP